jgi:hypothetical protein
MCDNCKYFIYDNSTGQADCKQLKNMTEKEIEQYFTCNKDGCPYKWVIK